MEDAGVGCLPAGRSPETRLGRWAKSLYPSNSWSWPFQILKAERKTALASAISDANIQSLRYNIWNSLMSPMVRLGVT